MNRQKVAAACDNCRRRKVKCDGQQPSELDQACNLSLLCSVWAYTAISVLECQPCLSRQDTLCVYSRGNHVRRTTRPLIAQTSGPRSELPVSHPLHPAAPHPPPALLSPFQSSPDRVAQTSANQGNAVNQTPVAPPPGDIAGSQPSTGTPTSFPNAVAPERAPGSTLSLTSAPTSGLKNADAMTGLVGDHTANVEYFGSSSAISFMRQINTAIDTLLGRSQVAAHSGSGVAQLSQTSIEAVPIDGGVVDPMTCTLPSRAFADGLMQDYYRLVWVILPIHDWLVFEKGYRAIWLGEPLPLPEKELYYMVNLAFALGSQFSDKVSPGKRNELGQTFWKRAQALYDPRLQPTATLGGVQCLLMMGLFLQGTSESHQCWMAIGSAVRMAQSLGLHMASTVSNESFRELEISRRVWHGCVSMDR